MILSDVETHYINSNESARLVRYDLIKIDEDNFIIKVFDNEYRGKTLPSFIHEVAELKVTREDYNYENDIGSSSVVRNRLPTTFHGHVLVKCQQHRDSLE
ncbi:hypothetical protein ACSDIA_000445 [Cronobacter turicensis]|uniref:hypothetical protein n=1 Tax=Cronobacter turicensis TaxID=413502 RepID=UPI001412DAE0|nr:hypothetical protein [Cronobacter turicensis]EKY3198941.1 hypothetical protein [Cronobacter turicensis]EKY3213528.1 hypothetical protein [Cronobacter turicensis]EKY3217555.1 hypothetical protein [Cronobacter turicensis]ELY5930608.1 hypothetical protein [Cronobacter turicensis]MDI7404445.1 hypothetical protein [Cronobacter turicensis]